MPLAAAHWRSGLTELAQLCGAGRPAGNAPHLDRLLRL